MKPIATTTYIDSRQVETKYGFTTTIYQRKKVNALTTYRVSAGETAYSIAQNVYKDKVQNPIIYYHLICAANNIINPFNLDEYINTDIVIPKI